MIDPASLEAGKTYRGRHPQARYDITLGEKVWNDRTIVWANQTHVQYDGPAVSFGRHFPRVTREKFARWAGQEIPAEKGDAK